jgi:hypothetical protein
MNRWTQQGISNAGYQGFKSTSEQSASSHAEEFEGSIEEYLAYTSDEAIEANGHL